MKIIQCLMMLPAILFCECSNGKIDNEIQDTIIPYTEWTDSYFKDNKFLFISNYCEEDTLDIVYSSLKNYVSLFDETLLSEHQNVRYDFIVSGDNQCIQGSAGISFKSDSVYVTLNFGGLEYKSYGLTENEFYNIGDDFNIFGRIVKDCIVVDADCEYNPNPQNSIPIVSYVFNKKYGLIYYLLESGDEFFRRDIFESYGDGTPEISSETNLHKTKLRATIP